MPITIPNDLPAAKVLQAENVFYMMESRALTQDIRPLRMLILNLMPDKITTETQLLRLLGNSPMQIEVTFLQMDTHHSRNTSNEHLVHFYRTFDEIQDERFDGLIITGAPIEHLPFEEVDYWGELIKVIEWSKTHVYSVLHICWAAQAGLYFHYGIEKEPLEKKLFGVYSHELVEPENHLLCGFDEGFMAPHSRHTTVSIDAISAHPDLNLLVTSEEAGVYFVCDKDERLFFVTGHPEYDRDTLNREYQRDLAAGQSIEIPKNYFPDDDPEKTPKITWRGHANLLYTNWINYVVYQATPYDLKNL